MSSNRFTSYTVIFFFIFLNCREMQAFQGPAAEESVIYAELRNRLRREDSTITLAELEQCVAIYPYDGDVWYRLADKRLEAGQNEAALVAYREVLKYGAFEPTLLLPTVHTKMAQLKAREGDRDSAFLFLRQALDAGYWYPGYLRSLPGLNVLQNDKRWEVLLGVKDVSKMTRTEGWCYDLETLVRETQRMHYNAFQVYPKQEQDSWLKETCQNASSLSDNEIRVKMMQYLKRVGGGHTGMRGLLRYYRSLPLVAAVFDEGIFVRTSIAAHTSIIGQQIIAIDGVPIGEVIQRLRSILPEDNSQTPKMFLPDVLIIPGILQGLKITISDSIATLTLRDEKGKTTTVRLEVQETRPVFLAVEQVHRFALPLYMQHNDSVYWAKQLPAIQTLYVQFNTVRNMPGYPLDSFASRIRRALMDERINNLVIDIRNNQGGNSFLYNSLLNAIIGNTRINRRGRLFIIIGPKTFSAAQNFATDLARLSEAMFVGEATGSSPNNIGETTLIRLPYSGMTASVSSLYWQHSWPTDYRQWITPDLPAPLSFTAFKKGEDPAMKVIEAYLKERKVPLPVEKPGD